jgi:hypothetical protein
MSKSTYPLKLPSSVKAAAARLAKEDGVSLNQFIAAAVAEKVGVLETTGDFLRRRSAGANPEDLLRYLRGAPDTAPPPEDARCAADRACGAHRAR